MKRLRDLMTQVEQSTDPAERNNLLHEHMVATLEEIKLLHRQSAAMQMMMRGGGGQMGMMGSGQKQGGGMRGGGMMRMPAMMQ